MDKNKIMWWLKFAAIIAWAFATIITCAGVWNYCKEGFVNAVAVALFLGNGYAVYRSFRTLKKNE